MGLTVCGRRLICLITDLYIRVEDKEALLLLRIHWATNQNFMYSMKSRYWLRESAREIRPTNLAHPSLIFTIRIWVWSSGWNAKWPTCSFEVACAGEMWIEQTPRSPRKSLQNSVRSTDFLFFGFAPIAFDLPGATFKVAELLRANKWSELIRSRLLEALPNRWDLKRGNTADPIDGGGDSQPETDWYPRHCHHLYRDRFSTILWPNYSKPDTTEKSMVTVLNDSSSFSQSWF